MAGNTVKSFSCPACGGTVTLRAAGHTVTAVCEHCASLIDTANEQYQLLKKYSDRNRETPIDIGSKATLEGIKWEVIGYMLKRDVTWHFCWDEYLLFNPYHGFRFLTHADGHWNWAKVLKRNINAKAMDSSLMLDSKPFSLYHHSHSKVEYVKGEFYWRAHKGEVDNYADYIAPPQLLTIEQNEQEMTVSMGQYLPYTEVEQAFGLSLSKPRGIAPNQPPPFAGKVSRMWQVMALAFVLGFLLQLSNGSERLLNETRMHLSGENADKSFSTPVFVVDKRSNVQVKTEAGLNNNWLSLNLSLVNEANQQALLGKQYFEFYSGTDSGEYWSEGNTRVETFFSGVDSGNYRLVVTPALGQKNESGSNLNINVKSNVSVWSNFWYIMFCLLLFPTYVALHRWYFEYRRWQDSDYAPGLYSFRSADE